MPTVRLAGLFGLAALGAQAQLATLPVAHPFEPVVVTATRSLAEQAPTLRDAVVITREDLDAAGPITFAEALQRYAGVEMRSTGGPGQPSGLILRGAGTGQTLVLIDGLRVGSASSGTTAIEAIPLEMIERIEVVKGPMSSLYGSDAIGGVVQVFTRGKTVPHLFGSAGYGSDNDRRISAGLTTVEGDTALTLSAGGRRVDSPSASTPRAGAFYDPDRDPHDDAFANARLSQRLWTGELLALEAFATRSRTAFDSGSPADRATQELVGARASSSTEFTPGWLLRLTGGYGLDQYRSEGGFPSRYQTHRQQGAFLNEFVLNGSRAVLGLEGVRERVNGSDASAGPIFANERRETRSVFGSISQAVGSERFEGNIRHDKDDRFGSRSTGSASLGTLLLPGVAASATYAQGFRAPTFNDLFGYPGFSAPATDLRPERSRSREASLHDAGPSPLHWRLTGFDNRLDDLIATVKAADGLYRATNVARARVRGIEAQAELTWYGVRFRAQVTMQRARDEEHGTRLPGRADRFGTLDASRRFGAWTVGANVVASGAREDSPAAAADPHMGGYARIDARLRYTASRFWQVELAAVNLTDKRYENSVGFSTPRRGAFVNVRFEAF